MQVEKNASEPVTKNQTTIERKSDCELVVTRTFNGPAEVVFDAWTKPELVTRWWAPRSFGIKLVSCEIDLRVGGQYRYVFAVEGPKTMEFYGTYLEVQRPARLVWTNADAGDFVSTATFTEKAGRTTLTLHELHPSKEALDEALASGVIPGTCETFDQLDELLAAKIS
ncbi:MAG: SRPBCC family protein [Myxococcales bacterium]